MKAIKKLRIMIPLAMLFFFSPLIYLIFKDNIIQGIALITLVVVIILFRLLYFKYKNVDVDYENYRRVQFYYLYGVAFIFLAILASIGTIGDWEHILSIPLFGIVALIGLWTFGILIVYYTYQAKKESPLKKVIIKKRK